MRDQKRVHDAVRLLLQRMNLKLREPQKTREKSACCGDSLYGVVPVDKVKDAMRKRAAEMPVEDVAVYCVSCVKAMYIGGKKPRHMADLLFGEDTPAGVLEPEAWHGELDKFVEAH